MTKRKLKQRLIFLKENYGICGLKGGTEVEDLSFAEIAYLRKVTRDVLPLTIKIGGPEARNDIRFLLEQGVDKVLGPMIESPYGLKNFIGAVSDMESYYSKTILKAMNTETITTYQNLDEIYSSDAFKKLHSITVGRSDLAGSMNQGVDDPEVMKVTQDIVKKAQKQGKMASVGGKITVKNIESVKQSIAPDLINTRHIVFDAKKEVDLNQGLKEGLLLEIELYKAFKKIYPKKKQAYENRIQDTLKRAGI